MRDMLALWKSQERTRLLKSASEAARGYLSMKDKTTSYAKAQDTMAGLLQKAADLFKETTT